jgi:hypothetical protein
MGVYDKATQELRRLHNEELYDLYSSSIKRNQMGTPCGTYGREDRSIHGFGGET